MSTSSANAAQKASKSPAKSAKSKPAKSSGPSPAVMPTYADVATLIGGSQDAARRAAADGIAALRKTYGKGGPR